MNDVEIILEKLFDLYNVATVAQLSDKIGVSQKTISNWKIRNSISAVKKRCRELGIYNDIFGNSKTQIIESNSGQVAQDVDGNQNFSPVTVQTPSPSQPTSNKTADIDDATFGLFKEAYQKAKENSDLKGLRIHLMEY